MDAGKTNIVLHNITLGKRNELLVLILTAINYVLSQVCQYVTNKQLNCKSTQWRPDGEYYNIKLFFLILSPSNITICPRTFSSRVDSHY